MTPENWQKVKEIFYPALELPAAERFAFVKQKCGADEHLLEEIEHLLEAHDRDETFIENSAFALTTFLSGEQTPNYIGENIGAYQIEREIGRGGMGAVYLASRADQQFDKRVAIKLIKRGFDTDEIIRRFRAERQILATLNHPNITSLIDGGATEDGLPYLVMDYVEGEPLTKYCEKRDFSIGERLNLFLQVCAAVSYAHQNLIIHRDLKPSNILVTKDGTPKLLDFGIAKLVADEANGQTLGEHTATRVMTPEYASPEQISGAPVTTATDVYSLGVLLYELLTGQRPFRVRTQNAAEISRIITEREPTRPSSLLIRSLPNEGGSEQEIRQKRQKAKILRGDLDNIILMAMRKEPERRYSSVEQFANDIERYLNNLPVLAQEDTFAYRASKFVARNKTGVAAAGGIAISLLAGIFATQKQSRIARRERDNARGEAAKAARINRFLQEMLAAADPHAQGKDVTVLQTLQIAAERIETQFADQPDVAADLRTTIGKTHLNLGQTEAAESHLKAAHRLRSEIFSSESEEVAVSLSNLGLLFQNKGDFVSAEPLLRQSLAIFQKVYGEKNAEAASIYGHLGYLYLLQGKHEAAVEAHHQELAIRRALDGENHPNTARAIAHIADCFGYTNDWKRTEMLYRQAYQIIKRHYQETHPDFIEIAAGLANALLRTDAPEAEQSLFEVLEMKRGVFGEEHPQYAWTLYNLAFLMNNRADFEQMQNFAEQIVKLRDNPINEEHPVISAGLQMLSISLAGQGKAVEAEPLLRESLALRERTIASDHWLLTTSRSVLGECLAQIGKFEEAAPLICKSYERLKLKLGAQHEQTKLAFERVKRFEAASDAKRTRQI